jgi:adenine-specific DNA-methyltransferase
MEAGEKRCDKGEYWWELRTCDYYDRFEKSKIIIPTIVQNASYSLDRNGLYSNDKTSIIATDDLYLFGVNPSEWTMS